MHVNTFALCCNTLRNICPLKRLIKNSDPDSDGKKKTKHISFWADFHETWFVIKLNQLLLVTSWKWIWRKLLPTSHTSVRPLHSTTLILCTSTWLVCFFFTYREWWRFFNCRIFFFYYFFLNSKLRKTDGKYIIVLSEIWSVQYRNKRFGTPGDERPRCAGSDLLSVQLVSP